MLITSFFLSHGYPLGVRIESKLYIGNPLLVLRATLCLTTNLHVWCEDDVKLAKECDIDRTTLVILSV